MKVIKRQLSILLAVLMVFTCINPYVIQVRAEEKVLGELLSGEEINKTQTNETLLYSDSSTEEKQELVEETPKEEGLKEETAEEKKTEEKKTEEKKTEETLEFREKKSEELAAEPYNEDDFWISGVSFNGLTPQGTEKLKAKNGVLEFPELKTSHGNDVSLIMADKFKNLEIEQLIIPNTIEEIGMNAFYGNKIKELNIPGSVKKIKPDAFAKNQISKLMLSEGLEIIYPSAFADNQIKEVVIPDSVKQIRVYAFERNPGDPEHENKVVLYVTDADKIDFYNDPKGKDRYFIKPKSNGNTNEYTAEDFVYDINGDIVSITGMSDSGKEKRKTNHNLVIPDTIDGKNVTEIGEKAFYNIIVDTTTGQGIIDADSKFLSVTLPQNLEVIGNAAFKGNEITEINFPTSLQRIGNSAFEKNQFTEVFIPEAVIEIGFDAFSNNKITKAEINNSSEGIQVARNAFWKNGKDGKTKISPKYLKETPEWKVADFKYERVNVGSVKITGLSDSGKEKRKTNHNLVIPNVIDGEYVTVIFDRAFWGKDIAEEEKFVSVVLPEHLVEIGQVAFSQNKLSAIKLPNKLKKIGNASFSQNKLKEVFIPESVTEIRGKAFAENELAEGTVKINNKKANVVVGSYAFSLQGVKKKITVEPIFLKDQPSIKYNISIKAPTELVEVITSPVSSAKEGETVKVICNVKDDKKEVFVIKVTKGSYKQIIAFNTDKNTFTMPKEDVEITVFVREKYTADKWHMEDFICVRYEVGDIDDDYYINEITVKGFSDKGLEKLKGNKEVVLPEMNVSGEPVESVFAASFINKGITKLTVPANYVKIYRRAFKDNKITKLVLNEGIVDIHENAFENNELTEFIAPKTKFKYVGNAAFKNNKIKKVILTDNVKTVEAESFMNNEISELVLGNKLERIASKAFSNNKLTEVNIPVTLKKATYYSLAPIEKDAFDNNSGKANPLKPSEKKVLLWTPQKNNPNKLPDGNNYVVDPVVENKEYLAEDFSFSGNKVDGFSDKGLAKYKKLGSDVPVKLPAKDTKNKAVIGIEDYAFESVSPEIKKIIIPDGYVSIGQQAFSGSEITEVTVPDSMESIDVLAFLNYSDTVVIVYVSSEEIKNKIGSEGNYWKVVVKQNPINNEWTVEDFTYGDMDAVRVEDNGTQTPIKLKAVTGFSDKGLKKLETVKDLVLPTKDDKGEKLEAVANGAFKGTFGEKRLNTLTIPEGYVIIESMAFAFNRCGNDLILPETLEAVGVAAFFRNEFTSITIPTKLTEIPLSMMRGNKLKKVIFRGNVESIGRLAFSENEIEEITVPDSLKMIGEQAFTTNTGSAEYDDKVVIRTVSGKNPQKLKDKENYIIDPSHAGSNPNINYNEWTTEDFEYKDTKVTGFSKQGLRKIKKNRNLVIPDKTPDGKAVLVIGIDAFRNLNAGYDIKSVKLPDTVVEIEDYALQFNEITEVKLPRDLKTLGMGVFMMSNVTKVEWNKKLEYIDQACFYDNELGKIEFPASVHTVMNAAFRKCSLTEVKFAKDSKLKTIETLAFADNKLSNIDLPNGIEKIGSQAFGNDEPGIGNKFTELNVPASLKEIGFQAFANNPGMPEYKAVVIHTPEGKNPNGLVDDAGKTFVIDPVVLATDKDKAKLKEEIEKAEKVDSEKLTEGFKRFFKELLKEAKETYADKNAAKAKVLGFVNDLGWAVKRAGLSILMFEKETLDSQSATFDKEKWKQVEETYKSAKKYLMVINITDEKLDKLIHDLDVALKALKGQGGLEEAEVYEGEAPVKKTHYIEPYNVKVKVWVKDGKIVFVKDNGTVCDDPDEHEEHNRGYFEKAIEILHKYVGKDVKVVKNSVLGSGDLNINAISGATVSSHALHNAIKNALGKDPVNPNPPAPNPPTPKPPVVPNSPVNPNPGGSVIPPISGGSSNSSGSSGGGSSSGTSSGGSGSITENTTKTETTITDKKTPLANIPTEKKALILKSKKTINLKEKQLLDVLSGKYSHLELRIGEVTLKLMPKDIKALFKKGKGKSYLKVSKLGKAEIKKLKLNKKISEKDIYKVELMISGQKVIALKNKILIQFTYREMKKTTVNIILADSEKLIKGKYNKKNNCIEFKSNKLGIFGVGN